MLFSTPKLSAVRRSSELFQGPILDLADPLFRDSQNLAHLDERPGRLAPETKPELEDKLFPRPQGFDQVAY